MTKVLIVEDEEHIRHTIASVLELSDIRTVTADNGADGFELAKMHLPDLIISDIMMPKLDGFGLLREINNNETTAGIPFLFLSAKSDKTDVREGMNLGADDFISKPFDIEDLLASVRTRLKKKEFGTKKYEQRFDHLRTSIRRSLPHEIRTPLVAILGFTDFIVKGDKNLSKTEIIEMVEQIRDSGQRLNRLFENYLMFANLEIIQSNEKDIFLLKSKASKSAEYIIAETSKMQASSYDRNEDLRFDIIDSQISVSEEYLMKVVEEISDNAFKYSQKGSPVEISSRIENDRYVFQVKDYGRGFTPEQISCVGAYVQFERRLYEQQGLGLGIAIAKKIVELHSGSFAIESEHGEYSIITVDLPIRN